MFVEEAISFNYTVPASQQRTVADLDREHAQEERMKKVRAARARARVTTGKGKVQ